MHLKSKIQKGNELLGFYFLFPNTRVEIDAGESKYTEFLMFVLTARPDPLEGLERGLRS